MGVPPSGWFTREVPIEMDDLGVPRFMETPICFHMLSEPSQPIVGILPIRRAAEMVVPFTGTAALHETSPHQGVEGIRFSQTSIFWGSNSHRFHRSPGISDQKSSDSRQISGIVG